MFLVVRPWFGLYLVSACRRSSFLTWRLCVTKNSCYVICFNLSIYCATQDKWKNTVLLDVDTYVKMWGTYQMTKGSYTEDEKTHTVAAQKNAKQAVDSLLYGISKEGS
jgi:hypothetical protein